jgi:hypothetical protein
MSWDAYDPNCRGCRPALTNLRTGRRVPDTEPPMPAILALFETLSDDEKRAWHAFTCLNSRDPAVLAAVESFASRMQAICNSG